MHRLTNLHKAYYPYYNKCKTNRSYYQVKKGCVPFRYTAFWFADVFNYYLFEGRQVIQAEDLEERDATEVLSIYGKHEKEMQKQKRRDLLKYSIVKANKETCFVLLGIENQSDVHYAMPVKTMVYDAMNYGSQVD